MFGSQIAGFLELRELPAVALTSRRMWDAASDDVVFRAVAERLGLAGVAEAAASSSEPGRRWFSVLRHLVPARREVRAIVHRFERGERRLALRQRRESENHRRRLERQRRLRERRLRGDADGPAALAAVTEASSADPG